MNQQITWDDFIKVDSRIGLIEEASNVEGSDKLIRMVVDFGNLGKKVVFSGIRKFYQPEDLINKKTVFVVNVIPKKVMGELSEAMIVGASTFAKATADKKDEEEEKMSILILEKDLPNGTKVY